MEITNVFNLLEAHPESSFLDVAGFNGHQFGTVDITGISPVWEMHPDTDEFFYVLDGEAEFLLLEPVGAQTYTAGTGSVFVVPKGIWHKPGAPAGVKLLYLTPGVSLHSDAEDPRTTSE